MPGNDSEKVSFKFMFKCPQRRWWRHFWRKTIPDVCRRNTKCSVADCSETCVCGTARTAQSLRVKLYSVIIVVTQNAKIQKPNLNYYDK